jgi:hypothetical protein
MRKTQSERNVQNQAYGEQTDRHSGRQPIATSRDVGRDEKQASVTLSTRYRNLRIVMTTKQVRAPWHFWRSSKCLFLNSCEILRLHGVEHDCCCLLLWQLEN